MIPDRIQKIIDLKVLKILGLFFKEQNYEKKDNK